MATLVIAGCKHTTKELISGLLDLGFTIDLVITISPELATKEKVAGYVDLRPFLVSKNIRFYSANSYSLKSDEDQQQLKKESIDVLLVMGWQRLIPEWFLDQLSRGAFGMHGSNKPLPHGRGRSPLNWSLILDKNIFFTHLFKYKPGVDDGDIVGYQIFDITPWDTALTLHYKNLLSMLKLCEVHLPEIIANTFKTFPQKEQEPSFFPKRDRDDGIIFWESSTLDIYNLIRAVTHPFPGAFTFLDKNRIVIWRAIPFDSHIDWYHASPGQILFVFDSGLFLVKTGDTTLLVQEYEGIELTAADKGKIFNAASYKRRQWDNLPI